MSDNTKVDTNAKGFIDWGEVPEGGFELLPVGMYNARVSEVEIKEGQSGYDYYNFTFKLTDPEYDNRTLWGIASFAPKALPGTFQTLCSILGEAIPRAMWSYEEHADDFIGKLVRLKVGVSEYNGNTRNQVERITGASAAPAPAKAPAKGKAKALF